MKDECSLRIEVGPEHVSYLNGLLDLPNETGHVLYFNLPEKFDTKRILNVRSKSFDRRTNGSQMGVITPVGSVNLHTHPRAAYNVEGCKWGWPSGEDMREVIRYTMKGMVCHFVITLEGIYTIQVNPCVISRIEKLTPVQRGIVMNMVEIYFRSMHIFRTKDHLKKYPTDYKFFIRHANQFSLDKMVQGVPILQGTRLAYMPFGTYFENNVYQDDSGKTVKGIELSPIDKKGNFANKKVKGDNVSVHMNELSHLISHFKLLPCEKKKLEGAKNVKWGHEWFHVSFFPTGKTPFFQIFFDSTNSTCYPKIVMYDHK